MRGPEWRLRRVLVVASPGAGGTTVNLLAPALVNEADGPAAQVVLDGQGYPVRAAVGAFE
ncbi:flagellar assembly protein FliW [Sinomonas soli]